MLHNYISLTMIHMHLCYHWACALLFFLVCVLFSLNKMCHIIKQYWKLDKINVVLIRQNKCGINCVSLSFVSIHYIYDISVTTIQSFAFSIICLCMLVLVEMKDPTICQTSCWDVAGLHVYVWHNPVLLLHPASQIYLLAFWCSSCCA